MNTASPLGLVLDLAGTFAFALNGALTAVRVARVDIIGVITLGMITALGGGIVRDVLLGALPPSTFLDWRYLLVATLGGLLAFGLSRQLERLATPITVFDALGLSLFAVTGAAKALDPVPTVLQSELYAIPALAGATVVVLAAGLGVPALLGALLGAGLCLLIRLLGVGLRLDAPRPPGGSAGRDA